MAKGRIRSAIRNRINTKVKESPVVKKMKRVRSVIENIAVRRKIQKFGLEGFRPKYQFEIKKGNFTVKTVNSFTELTEALKLRFRVFHKEYMKKKRREGIDVDDLDMICDHLMIRDDSTGQIVGTFRLNSSVFSENFYSSSEFNIEEILALPGNKLELGRACIEKTYRTGSVMVLLWRGIGEYLYLTQTDIMFGCASVKTTDTKEIALVTRYLQQKGDLKFGFKVEPTPAYRVPRLSSYLNRLPDELTPAQIEEAEELMPALFSTYLRMGIKAYGAPALDEDFHCIDYLIMMRTDSLAESYKKRFTKS